MSGESLRAAVERVGRRLNSAALDAWDEFNESEGMHLMQAAAGAAAEAYEQSCHEIRKALADHPATEPPNECATPTCPACYPAGGEVTADEIYDVLHQSWLASPEFLPDHRAAAAAILARFHVTRRADA